MARKGKSGLFTYDFGVAIAQGTVLRIGKMTTAATALAGAMYFLNRSATAYVKTLRENTAQFGGIINTMQKMQQAQDRIVKGQTAFSVDDQMKGMQQLMAAGLDVEKNFEFINKAAHAMGQSFTGFSSAITASINGDTSALVQMGLITQRAAKRFDVYQAGTIQRQQAIMDFLYSHGGIQKMVAEDFQTVNDKLAKLTGTFKQFILDVIGNPKDPNSLYAKAVEGIGYIADALERNMDTIRNWGERVGEILGWVIKNFAKFVVYLGKQFTRFFMSAKKAQNTFAEGTKSAIVWLEFWKLRLKKVFDTVFDWLVEHKGFLKNLAIAIGAIFALDTVTRWVGVLAAGIKSLNPILVGISAAIIGVSYLLDRWNARENEMLTEAILERKKLFSATSPESAGEIMLGKQKVKNYLDPKRHTEEQRRYYEPIGSLSAEEMAKMAVELQMKRIGRTLSAGATDILKEKYFQEHAWNIWGNVEKVLNTKKIAEVFYKELDLARKRGEIIAVPSDFSPSGTKGKPSLLFGGQEGTVVFGEALNKQTDAVDAVFNYLESSGITKDDGKKLIKEVSNKLDTINNSISSNLGATYIQNGAMRFNVTTDDGKELLSQAKDAIKAEQRRAFRTNPSNYSYQEDVFPSSNRQTG